MTQSVSCSLCYPRSGLAAARRGSRSRTTPVPSCASFPALATAQRASIHRVPSPRSSPPRRSHQTGLKVNNSVPQPGAGSGREHPRWGARGGRGPQAEPGRRDGAAEGDTGGTYDQGWATNTSSFHSPGLCHSLVPFPRCPPAPPVLGAGCPPARAVMPGAVCRAPRCSCRGTGVACHSRHLAPRRSKPSRRIKDKTLQVSPCTDSPVLASGTQARSRPRGFSKETLRRCRSSH